MESRSTLQNIRTNPHPLHVIIDPTYSNTLYANMSETQSKRLERMEGKIDKLHEGFVSMARMEERIVSLFKNKEATDKQMEKLEESFNKRIDSLENIVKDQADIIRTNAQVTSRITKLFWAAIAAIPAGWIGLIFYMLRDSI